MKHSRNRQSLFLSVVIGLLLATAIPATALGQGHGRGHGKGRVGGPGGIGWPTGNTTLPNHDRKCAKFRNCHDARDGRWDNRGPRADRLGNILGTRIRRHRNSDDNDLVWRNRRNREARNNFWRNHGRRVGRRVIANR